MTPRRPEARRSRGFLMMGLVLAVMSVCVALAYNQNTGRLHDVVATSQIMRAEQARWLAEGLLAYQVRLAVQPPNPPDRARTSPYTAWSPGILPWMLEFNRGPLTQDPSLVFQIITWYGPLPPGPIPDNHAASVRLYANPAMTGLPLVYRRARRRAMTWSGTDWNNLGYFDSNFP